jgi:hypothetical protein
MKRFLIAAVTCLALTVGVAPAMAGSGLDGVAQTLTAVTQRNANTAGDASASNANGTLQSNDQSQAGSGGDATTGDASTGNGSCCGSSGNATSGDAQGGDVTQSQEASNSNSTTQNASAESKAEQTLPVNVAVPICVAATCDTGEVKQSNTNSSGDAGAENTNATSQSNEQSQQGVGGDASTGDATAGGSGAATSGDAQGGDVTQSQEASNSNSTTQDASAESRAKQTVPVNVAVPVCIAKDCRTGDVQQSNENRSGDASASNENGTWQSNAQSQAGSGGDATTGDATTGKGGCCGSSGDATSGDAQGGDVTQSQEASNSNSTTQDASAESRAKQTVPVNVAVPVCVAKHCDGGGVRQTNRNRSGDAWAGNVNHTGQSNEQSQKGVGGNASTGDATTKGGCCTPPEHPKPACPPKGAKGQGKGSPPHACDKGCTKADRGPDATSGNANGGDVDQRQQASNDNRTTQTARATSAATQEQGMNLILVPCAPPCPPRPCPPEQCRPRRCPPRECAPC